VAKAVPVKQARILIVDDHPALREALAIRISRQRDLMVCGEAADMTEALKLVTEAAPDVAVIDISLKRGDGIDLIKRVKGRNNEVRMLVWSMHPESLYAERALRAGALGYINKDQATEKIIEAIRRVLSGKIYLSDSMTDSVIHRAVVGKRPSPAKASLEALADRELEVFRMIGQGLKTSEIAERLHLSIKTIETYRDRIRLKLDIANGAELAQVAAQWSMKNRGDDSRLDL